jgi:hypothetical protein
MSRLLLFPYTFVLLNWAAVKALYCFLRGDGADRLWGEPHAAGPGGWRAAGASKP